MLVYAAYGLLITHVTLGALQSERSPVLAVTLALGFLTVLSLHLAAARRERQTDEHVPPIDNDGFVDVCDVDEIPEKRAVIVSLSGERVAVFRYDGKISAISNVCQHQNGPLGEGRIIDGCVTCPWHGYQYRPEDGASPPPFPEKVPTFCARVRDGRVLVHPRPYLPGTRVEPACITESNVKSYAPQCTRQ
jgi:nitrite reductase/ring-hydroxylating ferredoxin subunit